MSDCLACIRLYNDPRPYQRTRRQLHPLDPGSDGSSSTSSIPRQTFIPPLGSTTASSSPPTDTDSDVTAQISVDTPTSSTGLTKTQSFLIAFGVTFGVALLALVVVLLVRLQRRRQRRRRARSVHTLARDTKDRRFDLVAGHVHIPAPADDDDVTVFEIRVHGDEDRSKLEEPSEKVQFVRTAGLPEIDLDPDDYPLPLGGRTPDSESRDFDLEGFTSPSLRRTTTIPTPQRHEYGHTELHPYLVGWRDQTGAPLRVVIPSAQIQRRR